MGGTFSTEVTRPGPRSWLASIPIDYAARRNLPQIARRAGQLSLRRWRRLLRRRNLQCQRFDAVGTLAGSLRCWI